VPKLRFKSSPKFSYVSSKSAGGKTIIRSPLLNLRSFAYFWTDLRSFCWLFALHLHEGWGAETEKCSNRQFVLGTFFFYILFEVGLHDARSIYISNRQWETNLHHIGGSWYN
jgi:hypothetical protein